MNEISQKKNRLYYYFPGFLGFVISFVTVVALFGFYQVRRNHSISASLQFTNSVTLSQAVAAPSTVALMKSLEEVRQVPSPSPSSVILPPKSSPVVNDSFAKQESIKIDEQLDKNGKQIDQKSLAHKFIPGKVVKMEATAYCLNNVTASGVRSKYGIVAADPSLLPIGSIVRLYADEYSGLYSVLDTGGKIKGRKIDIYLADYKEATQFGRRKIRIEILRYGWNPQASSAEF